MTKLNEEQLINLNLLLSIEGIGPAKLRSLLAKFRSMENILSAEHRSLIETQGISRNLASRIQKSNYNRDEAACRVKKELEQLNKMKASILTAWDEDYPPLLKKIYDPPLILFYKGSLDEKDEYSIAMVGTRQPSNYGKVQAEKIASELANQNITIVSGLARGIDSLAHLSAVKNNARTIAVIGSGLDVIYPPENKKLFDQITECGAIISEYNLGTKPDAQNFPKRNRIISGLSLGCIIIETGINGGAMQTAAFALEQNREVFAVPGNLGIKQSEGTNLLIQRGEAKLITSAEDILVELQLKLKPVLNSSLVKKHEELNLFEEKILASLNSEPLHIDKIAEVTNLTTSDCLVHLLTLEFKGMVKQLPGKIFAAI